MTNQINTHSMNPFQSKIRIRRKEHFALIPHMERAGSVPPWVCLHLIGFIPLFIGQTIL